MSDNMKICVLSFIWLRCNTKWLIIRERGWDIRDVSRTIMIKFKKWLVMKIIHMWKINKRKISDKTTHKENLVDWRASREISFLFILLLHGYINKIRSRKTFSPFKNFIFIITIHISVHFNILTHIRKGMSKQRWKTFSREMKIISLSKYHSVRIFQQWTEPKPYDGDRVS